MRKLSVFAVLLGLLMQGQLLADHCCGSSAESTSSHGDVASLISDWKAAFGEWKALPEEVREKRAEELISAAESCPVGSRVGPTIGFLHRALDEVVKLEKIGEEHCPVRGGEHEHLAALKKTLIERAETLRQLSTLASLGAKGAGPLADAKCCGSCGGQAAATKVAAKSSEKCCGTCGGQAAVATAASDFCPQKATEIAVSVRKESCPVSAAKKLVSAVPGLECETKAAGYVERIRSADCDNSAAQVVLAAVSECSASGQPASTKASASAEKCCGSCGGAAAKVAAKSSEKCCGSCGGAAAKVAAKSSEKCCGSCGGQAAVAAAASDFCPQKATEIAVSVRQESCPVSAAKKLVSAVPGLECETKAAGYVERIRSADCDNSAAQVVLAAVSECSASTSKTSKDHVHDHAHGAAAVNTSEHSHSDDHGHAHAAVAPVFTHQAHQLVASWKKGSSKLASFSESERKDWHQRMSKVKDHCASVRLMPRTLHTLAKGLEEVESIDQKLHKTLEAHPDLARSLPEPARAAYLRQAEILRSAREVLREVRSTMGGVETATASASRG